METAASKTEKTPKVWEKSIGGLGSKSSLKNLVVRKGVKKSNSGKEGTQTATKTTRTEIAKTDSVNSQSKVQTIDNSTTGSQKSQAECGEVKVDSAKPGSNVVSTACVSEASVVTVTNGVKPTSLGLLGSYSDSGSNSDSD